MSRRQQRHHVVPRLHLRGFADDDKMLVQLDLTTGQRRSVSISNAAVIRNFYTVVLPDGTRSDAWEQWLGGLENEIAPALRRAINSPQFDLSEEDRLILSKWIALQALRGPDSRRSIDEIASMTTRMQVGMGGIAYLRHAMTAGLGRAVTEEEAEEAWQDLTSPEGPEIVTPGDEHLRILASHYEQLAATIYNRSWGRIRFTRHRLAVSDVPVIRIRGDIPEHLGVGLADAHALAVPLDRETLLWMELTGHEDFVFNLDLDPTTHLARAHNTSAVLGAERFIYFHPDDDPIGPIAAKVEIPRPLPKRLAVVGGMDMVNRDRELSEVLEQIASGAHLGSGGLIADYSWPIEGHRPRTP